MARERKPPEVKFDDMAAFPIREAERETPTGLTNALTFDFCREIW